MCEYDDPVPTILSLNNYYDDPAPCHVMYKSKGVDV